MKTSFDSKTDQWQPPAQAALLANRGGQIFSRFVDSARRMTFGWTNKMTTVSHHIMIIGQDLISLPLLRVFENGSRIDDEGGWSHTLMSQDLEIVETVSIVL